MDLQKHPDVTQARIGERSVHSRHSPLDEVGAGALDWGVDGRPLGPSADRRVGRADVGQEVSAAPEQRLGEAMLTCEGERAVREGANSGEALVIAIDDRLAFVLWQPEPPGDAPGRASVENSEIDRLGLVAGVAVDPSE